MKKLGKPKVLMSIILIFTIGAVGLVLASNLTINSNANIEFGQGVEITSSCDAHVTFTPSSIFNAGADGYDYRLNSFTFSNLDLTDSGCKNKWLVINAFAKNDDFASYTVENNIQSELFTSCDGGCESSAPKYNSTIAIRFYEDSGVEKFELALPASIDYVEASDLDIQFEAPFSDSSSFSIGFGYARLPIPSQALSTVTLETYDADSLPENLSSV
jgi:hypothetical protein